MQALRGRLTAAPVRAPARAVGPAPQRDSRVGAPRRRCSSRARARGGAAAPAPRTPAPAARGGPKTAARRTGGRAEGSPRRGAAPRRGRRARARKRRCSRGRPPLTLCPPLTPRKPHSLRSHRAAVAAVEAEQRTHDSGVFVRMEGQPLLELAAGHRAAPLIVPEAHRLPFAMALRIIEPGAAPAQVRRARRARDLARGPDAAGEPADPAGRAPPTLAF
jgi:hypothetical protein